MVGFGQRGGLAVDGVAAVRGHDYVFTRIL